MSKTLTGILFKGQKIKYKDKTGKNDAKKFKKKIKKNFFSTVVRVQSPKLN